jgi:hypothetical protein
MMATGGPAANHFFEEDRRHFAINCRVGNQAGANTFRVVMTDCIETHGVPGQEVVLVHAHLLKQRTRSSFDGEKIDQ